MAAYDYINLSGVVVADTLTTKEEVQQEYQALFGQDIDLSDETPEGVLINAEVITRNGIATNNADLANQINPNLAGGVFLDAIWGLTRALTGGRIAATRSTFSQVVNLTGVPGTVIPEGAIAETAAGDQFQSLSEVTLDGSGLASVAFQSVETGAIPAATGDLNVIGLGSPLGWETVSNTVAATLGTEEESDVQSRLRRLDTLALQGISVAEAITSDLNDLDEVKSLSFRENFTDTDMVIDGVFLLKHSIWVAVDGGSDTDIADALLQNKTMGANWNGAVTVNVTDPTSGQIYPVKFDRPDEIQMWVRVTIKPTTISNPTETVEEAILNYANGLLDGEPGFVVGADVSPFELGGAVNIQEPELFVTLVEVSDDGVIFSSNVYNIEIFEVARTSASQISLIIS